MATTEGSVHGILCAARRSYCAGPASLRYRLENQSASVQPSWPPTANAGTPECPSACASATSPSTSAGGAAPARSKTLSLYQIKDLLAALNQTPYKVPPTDPSRCQAGA